MRRVKIYDTTLRDGTQAEDFNLSLADKIRIAKKLAQMGIDYIEGGWPGSNPRDKDFFSEIHNYNLGQSYITAFGSTHHKDRPPETDPIFQELLISRAPVITIFGKSWTFHVKEVLRTTLERNLEIITHSLRYLKPRVVELFYDAEHFFDAFQDDAEYALKTLEAAIAGGADCLILCDTNGGTVTSKLVEIIKAVQQRFPGVPLGIHAHNDSDLAVANSIAAVEQGVEQVQGTINGVGERCGNANLCSIIPNLKIKLGFDCISDENLKRLTELSRYIYELANMHPNRYQPYVGKSAFAHKGGVHAAAVKLNPRAYEHINPEIVGNCRKFPVSDLSGKSTIFLKAKDLELEPAAHDRSVSAALEMIKELNINLPPASTGVLDNILDKVKQLESQGYQFEGADASLELLLRAGFGQFKEYFHLQGYRVVDQKAGPHNSTIPEATVQVRVGSFEVHTAALGNGPVNALYNALLKALLRFFPRLAEMRLEDYKVRVLPGSGGTEAKVRVLIETRDAHDRWGTVGVSYDIIEASWQALVDSINYKLFKDERQSG
ncbi:MAG: citramalate synthase [Deltaproteobacteria bacterium]|nr:citramalate synthase [Deltaproteobacteria bacterium]MBW1953031.1 citramalate synthase [Deltaproteobacteria bacterium]MBW1985977.1 citramalate synthase [Deltaproteobacteria bacterium]MBW2135480.1 citramalate synthase [Deltaproteobacteria bacterium]